MGFIMSPFNKKIFILLLISRNKSIQQKMITYELSKFCGKKIHQSNVSYLIASLVVDGLVKKEGNGPATKYSTTSEFNKMAGDIVSGAGLDVSETIKSSIEELDHALAKMKSIASM